MVGKGHAGICHSCQQDVLKQDYQDIIFCGYCQTEWTNKNLKNKKTAAIESMGMPCHACSEGLLMQQYGNIIFCGSCGTKWRAWKMKGYSKRANFNHEMSMTSI
jgi:uncharacterized CHY-type Zn-finger protein